MANRPLVLAGLPGAGKSAVGALLAAHRGGRLLDLDRLVEARAGMSVAEIFRRHGEARFRALEAETVTALAPGPADVVAAGGGTLLDPRNRARLGEIGTLALLDADDATLARRCGDGGRPLLDGAADPAAAIAALRAVRAECFAGIALRLDTTRLTPEEAAAALLAALRDHAEAGSDILEAGRIR